MTQPIHEQVAADLEARAAVGLTKYKTLLGDAGLTRAQLLQHAYEEALDLACYLKTEIERERGNLDHLEVYELNGEELRGYRVSERLYVMQEIYEARTATAIADAFRYKFGRPLGRQLELQRKDFEEIVNNLTTPQGQEKTVTWRYKGTTFLVIKGLEDLYRSRRIFFNMAKP